MKVYAGLILSQLAGLISKRLLTFLLIKQQLISMNAPELGRSIYKFDVFKHKSGVYISKLCVADIECNVC